MRSSKMADTSAVALFLVAVLKFLATIEAAPPAPLKFLAKFLGRLRDNDRATLVASMVAGGSKLMLSAYEISLDFEGL